MVIRRSRSLAHQDVIEAGDRPVDQTEALVTRPLERALSGVIDVESLRSTTSRGSSEIRVAFAWNSDMNLALQRVQTAVAQANAALPPGVTFTIRRMDPTVFPVAAYSLTSDRIGPVALRRYADLVLTPLLLHARRQQRPAAQRWPREPNLRRRLEFQSG